MIRALVWISFGLVFRHVFCSDDLCENDVKINSMVYISNTKEWFFTSGGHYWLVKDDDISSKKKGLPLPGKFSKGDFAYLKKNCRDGEIWIYLYELTGDGLKYVTFDVKARKWNEEPKSYEEDPVLSKANMDWSKPIESAFVYKSKLILIQSKQYWMVDFDKYCEGKADQGELLGNHSMEKLESQEDEVMATTMKEDKLYLFGKVDYWEIVIKKVDQNGATYSDKAGDRNIKTEFFKFEDKGCGRPTPKKSGTPADKKDSEGKPKDSDAPKGHPTSASATDEGGSTIWVIIAVIVIIVIICVIVLISCLAMRRKSPEGNTESQSGVGSTSSLKMGSSRRGSSTVSSPSTMSIRSQASPVSKSMASKK